VMDAALIVLRPEFEFDAGYMSLLDNAASAHHPANEIAPPSDRSSAAQRFMQHALESRTVQLLSDVTQLNGDEANAWRAASIGALAVVPLWGHDHVQGVLQMVWQQPRRFSDETAPLLAAIGQQIGVALERAHLYEVAQHRAQEIERSHRQLVQSEKLAATGRLAMSLAHEINNPLQAIQNCLHLTLEFELDTDRKTYYLNLAREEVERLSLLVQSMLDFYRPSRSDQPTADMLNVIERVLALSDQKLRHNQINVQLDFPAQPLVAPIASDQLGQVCLNLIVNAAEAMENGGTLRISACTRDDTIELRLADTGPGIPPADLPHIFEPFYTTKAEGTGLGLAIGYSIIEQHGGTLNVESQPDSGATFIIRLPKAE
jgi:signal transduction histidine kinase